MPDAEIQTRTAERTRLVRSLRARAQARAAAYPRATKYALIAAAALFVITCALTGYYYVTFSRMIDARLHGERDRVLPRVFARPLEIRRGDNVSQKELLDRLNDLGYAQRTQAQNPGEFAVDGALVSIVPRAGTPHRQDARRQFSAAARRRDARDARAAARRSAIASSR